MLVEKEDLQARFGACSEKCPRGNRCAKIHIQYTTSNEKPRHAASGGLKPTSCHHLVESEEAVEILALVRVMVSLEGLGERLPKLDSAGSAEVLAVFASPVADRAWLD